MKEKRCQQSTQKVALLVTGVWQDRQSGGVMVSTVSRQASLVRRKSRWSLGGFSAIGSSIMAGAPLVFDRQVYRARLNRASGDGWSVIGQRLNGELSDRLSVINRQFDKTLIIAPYAEQHIDVLQATGKCGEIIGQPPATSDELDLVPHSLNLVVSLMDLHSINDVPGYLAQIAGALRPDGLAMLAFFAGDTLRELREAWLMAEQDVTGGASPRVAPMIDLKETGGLLQRAGLALPVADMDRVTLRHGDALLLMREIKNLGLSNCLIGRNERMTSKRLLLAAAQHYQTANAGADGRVMATVEIAWAMAWKPHASQQQPLKPGSAKVLLADALGIGQLP